MDEANLRDALSLARDDADRERVRLLLAYVGGGEIPDPVEGGREDFQHAYEAIERACEALVGELRARMA
jgi:protein-tyrosine phosphatase